MCGTYKKRKLSNFPGNLIQLAKTKLYKLNNEERIEELDTTLCKLVSEHMAMACNKTFRTQRASKKATAHKPVP